MPLYEHDINRSIDFTKVSTGLKLNPSIESVSLRDTIGWAVECMVNTHGNVPIVFPDVPSDVHNQIFTDKQWLTENLLCLMSNAQKFTTEGDITIRCALIPSLAADDCPSQQDGSNVEHLEVDEADYDVEVIISRPAASGTFLLLEVEDTGIGITKENREKLFKPFMQVLFWCGWCATLIFVYYLYSNNLICFRLQAQRRTGGTGLGLYSLSKRLESLGGECGVRSRSDGLSGSCFWFTIPYKPDQTNIVEQQLSVGNITECSFNRIHRITTDNSQFQDSQSVLPVMVDCSLNQSESCLKTKIPKLRILLVDDAPMLRKATSRALMKEGHDVEVAHHGAECLKVLESKDFAFDLILMDLQMPVMDGLEASQRIRVLESNRLSMLPSDADISLLSNRSIMIIGLSANSESEAREDCMQSGMDGFIEKPLTMKIFRNSYSSLFQKNQN
jgi:CheY-like chemotaxis protein